MNTGNKNKNKGDHSSELDLDLKTPPTYLDTQGDNAISLRQLYDDVQEMKVALSAMRFWRKSAGKEPIKQEPENIPVPPILAQHTILGRKFMVANGSGVLSPGTIYQRVQVKGFLWNSHIIQDVNNRRDIIVFIPETNTISIMKGSTFISYLND